MKNGNKSRRQSQIVRKMGRERDNGRKKRKGQRKIEWRNQVNDPEEKGSI